MKLTRLFTLVALYASGLFTEAYSANLSDSIQLLSKPVNIGPPELGVLVDPEVLLKQSLDARLQEKDEKENALKRDLEFQQLYTLFNGFETVMEPVEALLPKLHKDLVPYTYRKGRDRISDDLLLNTLAVDYGKNGDLVQSAKYFKESLLINENLNNKLSQAKITQVLASLHKILKNYDEAVFYQEQNLRINSSLNKPNEVAAAYINIAALKVLQNNYKDAEFYILRKAFPLYRRMGNKVGRMSCFENLAKMYKSQNRLSEAKWFFLQENLMANKLNNIPAQVSSLISIAKVKSDIGETDLALANFKEAELLASANSFIPMLIAIKGNVGEIYTKIGNYSAAENALNEYNKLRDSLLNGISSKAF
jgi:tetratricopeptide (TPR) repeat protein